MNTPGRLFMDMPELIVINAADDELTLEGGPKNIQPTTILETNSCHK